MIYIRPRKTTLDYNRKTHFTFTTELLYLLNRKNLTHMNSRTFEEYAYTATCITCDSGNLTVSPSYNSLYAITVNTCSNNKENKEILFSASSI
jgi:hypothetical protein